jgi:V/A-type H+-transporting ATPase subunit A
LSVVGAFHGLSRARSDARRYPAVDPLISWTKYLTEAGHELNSRLSHWADKVKKSATMLRKGDEIGKRMEVVGEEGVAIEDMVLFLKSELYEFCYLQQNAFDKEDTYCPMDRQIEMFRLIQEIFEAPLEFDVHDAARSFFLNLQNELKNINFLPFHSKKYKEAIAVVEEKIHQKIRKV